MDDKKVLAYESDIGDFNGIVPAIKSVPLWYKKMPKKVKVKIDNQEQENITAKVCVPFLDALSTGYYMTLGQEIYVERVDDVPIIRYKNDPNPTGVRTPAQTNPMPYPAGYEKINFVWHTNSAVILPEGYSAVYCHPLNRFELPFFTVGAVVDADVAIPGGNIPFYLKEGFEGVIPKGTPIIQIIPFKREDWISKKVSGVNKIARDHQAKGPHDWYRKFAWKRKTYK